MSTDPEPSLREIGRTLAKEVKGLREKVDDLSRAIGRGRNVVIVVIVSLAFDLLFSAGLFYFAKRTSDLSTRTADLSAHNAELIASQCRSANEVRAQTLTMFEGIRLVFPKPPGNTAPDSLDAIVDLARKTFVQRPC